MTSPSLAADSGFRIQVLFENEDGAPIKEFNTGKLAHPTTFNVLSSHVFAMRYPNENKDQYNITFKYRIEERHESHWVVFEDNEGLGYAFESNRNKDYVYISATIVKKGAALPPSTASHSTLVVTAATTPVSPKSSAKPAAKKPKAAKKASATKHSKSSSSKGSKMPMEQKILIALKTLLSLGETTPPRGRVAALAGTPLSKSFANVLCKLKKSGLVEYPDSDTLRLTPAGIAKTGSVTPLTDNEQVHNMIRELLKGAETKIFNQLVDGRTHSREQVGKDLGLDPTKKSFANCLSRMSTLGFLEYVKGDDGKSSSIRLTDSAFLERPNEGNPSSTMSVVSNDDVGTEL